MTIQSSLKLSLAALALAASGAASATVDLTNQYALSASDTLVNASLKEYTFNYTVTNLNQSNGGNTGLDGFTIFVPDSAIYVGSTHPDAATPNSAGHWTEDGTHTSLDLSNGSGNHSQNLNAPAGFHAYTWWGQDPTSVYGTTAGNNSASFSITLKNVSAGNGTAGITSYFGGNTPVNGQEFASISYGNYTTFKTEVAGFSPTAAVPEPETYAMLVAGLGLLGFMARRRKNAQ